MLLKKDYRLNRINATNPVIPLYQDQKPFLQFTQTYATGGKSGSATGQQTGNNHPSG